MSKGGRHRQHRRCCYVPARSGPVPRPGRCRPHGGFPRLRAGGGDSGTAVRRLTPHFDALYALAYLYSHDDVTACGAVAAAVRGVYGVLEAGTDSVPPNGCAGLWRAMADHVSASYLLDARVDGSQGDVARRPLGSLRREAVALDAGGYSDSHAAALLGVSRPLLRLLARVSSQGR
jgi:hypothetical protein